VLNPDIDVIISSKEIEEESSWKKTSFIVGGSTILNTNSRLFCQIATILIHFTSPRWRNDSDTDSMVFGDSVDVGLTKVGVAGKGVDTQD
jgi:hypothetical protein